MLEFNPTDEQLEIIKKEESAIIHAGPGTGKTRTAIEKARYKIKSISNDSYEQVLFLSFSNAAVSRLAEAANIVFSLKEKKHIRLMTYHACAAELLRFYGRFVGLPHDLRIMDTLEEKLIFLEREWAYKDAERIEKLFELARNPGLVGFDVLIPLTIRLLAASERLRQIICRKYPLIVVDEFQDTSDDQWRFLKLLGENAQVVAFGDPNQIIYSSLHKATAERIKEFKEWKKIGEAIFSVKNFRCDSSEILTFAEALLSAKPYQKKQKSAVQIVRVAYRSKLRSNLAIFCMDVRKKYGYEKSICFLAPSNNIAEKTSIDLRNPPSKGVAPVAIHARIPKDESAVDSIMLAIAALRDFAILGDELSCNKAAISLLAMDLAWTKKIMSPSQIKKIKKIRTILKKIRDGDGSACSMLMERCKTECDLNKLVLNFIEAISGITELKSACDRIGAQDRLNIERVVVHDPQLLLFDDLRESRRPKGLYGYEAKKGQIHSFNYHKAKGREFDLVVMIVDPRGEVSKVPIEEQRRLYYVCATRAKEFLGVIYFGNDLGRVLGPVLLPAV